MHEQNSVADFVPAPTNKQKSVRGRSLTSNFYPLSPLFALVTNFCSVRLATYRFDRRLDNKPVSMTELLTIICRCTVQDHAIIHATRRPHRKVFIDRNYGSNLGIKQAASCRVRGKGAQTYCRIGCFRTIGRAGTDGRAIGGNSSSCPRRGSELPNLFSGGGQRWTLSRILCIGAPRSRIVRRGVLALRSSLRPE